MKTIKRIHASGILAIPVMCVAGYCVAWLLGLFAGAVLA